MRDDPILSSIRFLRCDYRCFGLGVDGGAVMLTLRQQTALYLVGEGYSDKMIGAAMGQSAAASHDQVRRACDKLGAANRSQGALMLRGRYA